MSIHQTCGHPGKLTQCKCGQWVCPECLVMHWSHNIKGGNYAESANSHPNSTRRTEAPDRGPDRGDEEEADSRSVVDDSTA